eukprot:gnl/TRDRNA2_/TRDRNA2_171012_c1_seq10.p1 gnl/TRDRNA2_/TRDRNA2_171012_c1~~gnl/TRDRNA2_/TRDRNA2_171012_c1_seq10.p1  ORF type:complete len:160 (+),score=19.59 gnl/TRDRNA2_/TRDRNA2_171012_c1_seq10:199-678(+)
MSPAPEDFELQHFICAIKQYNSTTMKTQWKFYRDGAYHDLHISKWDRLMGSMSAAGAWESYSSRTDVQSMHPSFSKYYNLYDGSMNVSLTTPGGTSIYFEGNWFYVANGRATLDFYANDQRAMYVSSERLTVDTAVNVNRDANFNDTQTARRMDDPVRG